VEVVQITAKKDTLNLISMCVCLSLLLLAKDAVADVAIVKSAGVSAFDEARNGFSSICFENKQEFNLLEDLSNKDQILEQVRAGNFSLILVLGSQAASLIRDNIPDKPLVFAFIIDPEKQGFKKDRSTGVALKVQIREQFIILRSIKKSIKRVGVLYTRPVNDALIVNARSAADDEDLELVTSPITSSLDLQQALTDLLTRVDALWIPPDPLLNSEEATKYIGSKSLESKIPLVGPSDRYTRSGAIFSLFVDTVETGRMAGDFANKILQGTPTSKLPFREIEKSKIVINLKAAGLLGLEIPRNIQDAASKVYQ